MKVVLGRTLAGAAAFALCVGGVSASWTEAANAAPAKALTGPVTIGQTVAVPIGCGAGTTAVQYAETAAPTYKITDAGVITSFAYQATNPGGVRAVVLGPGTSADHRTVLATSPLQTVTAAMVGTAPSFPVRIPAPAGSVLGVYVSQNDMGCYGLGSGASDEARTATFDPSAATDFSGSNPLGILPTRANISAVLEPDADHDGYGDISQDKCPQSAKSQLPCPAPDTTITKAPKKKTSKRKVKIKFASTIAGSTFVCTVDSKAPKACSSPYKKHYKKGKHTVSVTSISPAGIVDPTPASVTFKVKRKHHR